jgi:hypothetical protein
MSHYSDQGVSHSLSNALSPKLFFHYVRIVYHIVAVVLLLICGRQSFDMWAAALASKDPFSCLPNSTQRIQNWRFLHEYFEYVF